MKHGLSQTKIDKPSLRSYQLTFPSMESVVANETKVRKGLYLRASGTRARLYQVIKTTKKNAHLKSQETGKIFIIERRKLFSHTSPIGYNLT